jgi:hypothetical protein
MPVTNVRSIQQASIATAFSFFFLIPLWAFMRAYFDASSLICRSPTYLCVSPPLDGEYGIVTAGRERVAQEDPGVFYFTKS